VLAALLIAAMLAVGTTIEPGAVRRLRRRPATMAAVVAVNVMLLPAVALVLLWVSDVDGPIGLGVLLAAAAPGGGSGALLAHHARGTAVVSVGVQALLAVVGLAAVPIWLSIAAGVLDVGTPAPPAGGLAGLVLAGVAGQLVPLLAGVWLRARRPALADRVHPVARRAADLLLAGIVVWSLLTNADRLADVPPGGYLAIAIVVAVSLATYLIPGTGAAAERSAVAMVTTVRNLTLALFVAGFAADADRVILAVLVYGLVMYAAAAAAVRPMRRRVSDAAR
jgi:BASS family bile acid:Na+ symporter